LLVRPLLALKVSATVDPEHTGAPSTDITVIVCACKVDWDNKINKRKEKRFAIFSLIRKDQRMIKYFTN
jgi:hypothetical protein